MFTRALSALILGSFLLAGCGGGSSSSGSGSAATPGQTGTYRGTFEYSFKIRGQAFGQRIVPIVAVVKANTVEVQSPVVSALASRNGNAFEVSQRQAEQIGQYSCVGPWTVRGTIGNNNVNGRLIIDYTCTAPGEAPERLIVNSAWRAR